MNSSHSQIIVHNLVIACKMMRLARENSESGELSRSLAICITDLEKTIAFYSINIEMTPEVLEGHWRGVFDG